LKPTENNGWYEVTLFEGHNQQIRKMFDAVGHSVVKLKRISIGHIKDDRIAVGAYRLLDDDEIKEFKNPKPKKSVPEKKTAPKDKPLPPKRKPILGGQKSDRNVKFERPPARKPKR
jgi:23S rRNA pseudouridine2605 synthase